MKALGIGFSEGINWSDIEVVNTTVGQPTFQLHGKAKEVLEQKCPKGMRPVVHLSLSDTDTLALAYVVIEVISDDQS